MEIINYERRESMTPQAIMQANRYLKMFETIMASKNVISPRGMEIKEVEDLQLRVNPFHPFMTFPARKYNLDYFKKEMRWKLGASKYDESIKEHAKMWANVQNPDGSFNSNYGQYWFGEQMGIFVAALELIRDHDSRRAVIPMLNASHLSPQTKDTVCTESVGFRLRKSADGRLCLNMSVHMRSSDVIFGLGTDIPTFSFLYRLLFGLIGNGLGTPLHVGEIIITAMSSHIYSTHYKMVDQILKEGPLQYDSISMPFCSYPAEAMQIIASRGIYNMHNGEYPMESLINWIAV
jgi:thymidylate synthase